MIYLKILSFALTGSGITSVVKYFVTVSPGAVSGFFQNGNIDGKFAGHIGGAENCAYCRRYIGVEGAHVFGAACARRRVNADTFWSRVILSKIISAVWLPDGVLPGSFSGEQPTAVKS